MTVMVIGLVLFIGAHLIKIVAPDFRTRMIGRVGNGKWTLIYVVVSLLGLYMTGAGYGIARQYPVLLYELPFNAAHLTALLMIFSFVFVMAGNLPAGHIKAKLKHPMLIGVKTWAVAHLLVNGDLASLVLFGSLLAWAVIALVSLKRRNPNPPEFQSAKFDVISLLGGIILAVVFAIWLHSWLIGVPAIA